MHRLLRRLPRETEAQPFEGWSVHGDQRAVRRGASSRTAVTSNRGDKTFVEPKRSLVEREFQRLHGCRWLIRYRVVDTGETHDGEGVPVDELWTRGITVHS